MGNVKDTEILITELAVERGWWITGDGRIGESDAASIIGWSAASLRNARAEGRSPPWYRIGGAGHRISYRISEIASWIEDQREGEVASPNVTYPPSYCTADADDGGGK